MANNVVIDINAETKQFGSAWMNSLQKSSLQQTRLTRRFLLVQMQKNPYKYIQ